MAESPLIIPTVQAPPVEQPSTITATGGTQSPAAIALVSAAVAQVAATITATGGNQIISSATGPLASGGGPTIPVAMLSDGNLELRVGGFSIAF